MNGLPYYKRYPRDFVDGTVGMPFEEKTTYAFLLDLIYMHAGALPDDPRFIAGQLGCSVRKWNSIRDALVHRGKIICQNGSIQNYRAIIELQKLGKLQDNSKNAIRTRWDNTAEKIHIANKSNHLDHTDVSQNALPTNVSDGYHTESDTYKEEEDARGDCVFYDQIRACVGVSLEGAGAYWSDDNLAVHVGVWRESGLTDAEITAQATASRNRNPEPPDGPKALDRWMEAIGRAKANPPTTKASASAAPVASRADQLKFYADLVNGDGFLAPSTIKNTLAAELVAAGLVTPERLSQRGIR